MTTPLAPPEVVGPDGLRDAVSRHLEGGARLALVAGHHDADGIRVVHTFLTPGQPPREVATTVPDGAPGLPTLADLSFPAGRFEREVRDLFGVTPIGHPLPRRMVRHAHWPTGYYPMRHDAPADPEFEADVGSFPFIEITGDGVYEIPVGPVHAGLIEPGHFRFSVVGETVLTMKTRLWFVHRGVEKLFEGRTAQDAIELAERVSGDTSVGHTLAFVQAVEQALGLVCPAPDLAARALLLELERLHNHVADIGAIVNDVGYGVIHAHTQVLRERLLRHHHELTGHRLLRGAIGLGATRLRRAPDVELVRDVAAGLSEIVEIALGNHVAADRLTGTSPLPREQAFALGTLGYVARASGLTVDARVDHPTHPLTRSLSPVVEEAGDVRARFLVRAREATQSAALIAALARDAGATTGSAGAARGAERDTGCGLGVVEAWRGTLCHRVELTAGRLTRCKIVDPSFFNWPALPIAMRETIVPDFPLTNKSFNQSYAGNDL